MLFSATERRESILHSLLCQRYFYFFWGQRDFPRYSCRAMNPFANLCRALRDLGIFFAGIALLLAVLDYFYFNPDPARAMQRAMYKNMADAFANQPKEISTKDSSHSAAANLPAVK
jgi:hypothetical protein